MLSEMDEKRSQFFEQAAEGWEERNYPQETRTRTEELLAELEFAPGLTILDVGCGRGILIPILRGLAGLDARLLALDASASMLKGVADKDARTLAIHARAESIPLIDGYVDMVVCFSAFPHFSDKTAAAREFYRVLKPGGRVYVLHLASREKLNRHHEGHPAVHGDHMPDENAMRTIFTQAGFPDAVLRESPDRYFFSAVKTALQ